jgi:hypothetical protein
VGYELYLAKVTLCAARTRLAFSRLLQLRKIAAITACSEQQSQDEGLLSSSGYTVDAVHRLPSSM